MDDSKFNLWRATFSFCFIDGFLSPEENRYIDEKLRTLSLSVEQKTTLMNDLKSPPAIEKLLPLITKPADRGFLINNIRLLSRVDNLSAEEKLKIEELTKKVMARVDLNEVNAELLVESRSAGNKSLYTKSILDKLPKI